MVQFLEERGSEGRPNPESSGKMCPFIVPKCQGPCNACGQGGMLAHLVTQRRCYLAFLQSVCVMAPHDILALGTGESWSTIRAL